MSVGTTDFKGHHRTARLIPGLPGEPQGYVGGNNRAEFVIFITADQTRVGWVTAD